MLTVYQESVPFTNKRVDSPVSQNTFLNPIIMPFALNTTLGSNVLETVFYVKNNTVEHFYNDIVVCLMKEDPNLDTMSTNGTVSQDLTSFSVNNYNNIPITLAYESSRSPNILDGTYQHNYIPVSDSYFVGSTGVSATDTDIKVKFSYGYNQISDYEWSKLNSILVIPYVGNSTTPDTSYLPIRMRVEWLTPQSIFTIRKYFLDVSYSTEGNVV